MAKQVRPFLMFTGQAEEAMRFYTSLLEDAEIVELTRYGPEGPGAGCSRRSPTAAPS